MKIYGAVHVGGTLNDAIYSSTDKDKVIEYIENHNLCVSKNLEIEMMIQETEEYRKYSEAFKVYYNYKTNIPFPRTEFDAYSSKANELYKTYGYVKGILYSGCVVLAEFEQW